MKITGIICPCRQELEPFLEAADNMKRVQIKKLEFLTGDICGKPVVLCSSGIGKGTKRSLSSGIYVRTYPDRYGLGFMVSVKPHGRRKGIHLNRQNMEKPVLMWAEDGTRYRKAGRRISSFFGKSRFTGKKIRQYVRGGANRGKMKRYAFLAKTEQQTADSVETNLFNNLQDHIERAARKQGLI